MSATTTRGTRRIAVTVDMQIQMIVHNACARMDLRPLFATQSNRAMLGENRVSGQKNWKMDH